MALESDKLCNSSLFDEDKDRFFDTKMIDEMKFSFNNNEVKEID
jgi:hypothetical protein